ncbi:MAG: hypothetical protein E7300_06085 [Lachnospiraceae bacterium]|nr:hypothetical protein [Lachnospiraceae bacterium]
MNMAILGTYSNGVVLTDAKLKDNQKVLIVPIKKRTAFGGLHKYANSDLIPLEKEAFHEEIVESYLGSEKNS